MVQFVQEKELLRKRGLKATSPRLLILSLLRKSRSPLSIRSILKEVEDINFVTIYRTLDTFKKKGLASQVDFQHGHAHFEFNDERDHHHIVCTDCGKIEDFVGCGYDKIAQKAMKEVRGFKSFTGHSFELFAVCNPCSQKKN